VQVTGSLFTYYQEHSQAREDPGYYLLPMILNSIFLRASPFSFEVELAAHRLGAANG
jgi:hypothetical protein